MTNKSSFDDIPAGPELDAAIAVALFGWRWVWQETPPSSEFAPGPMLCPPNIGAKIATIPTPPREQWALYWDWNLARSTDPMNFSSNITAAWRVVEAMAERIYRARVYGWTFEITLNTTWMVDKSSDWRAEFTSQASLGAVGECAAAPEAICRAAMAALVAEREWGA